MKKTIEEVANELVPNRIGKTPFGTPITITPTKERKAFIAGAKYQSEQMYSEEDLREAFKAGQDYQNFDVKYAFNEWFNQFKKS